MNYLEERKIIQNMIKDRYYQKALNYFENTFAKCKDETNYKKIMLCLKCLQYLEILERNDYNAGYHLLNNLDPVYWNKDITISLYDNEDKIIDYNLEVILFYFRLFQFYYVMIMLLILSLDTS